MLGPQRHSLLSDQVIHREYSAQAIVDRILDRLVDTFDFQIGDKLKKLNIKNDVSAMPKTNGDAYATLKEAARSSWPMEKRPWSFQEKKQTMVAVMNQKLCSWLLDASPSGEKSNPLELGWSTHSLSKERQSAIADDFIFHGNDDQDGDDEKPLECSYAIMTC